MNRATVLVVGSINMDMVLTIERMPAAGENLFVRNFSMYPGGKGHNQTI
nr:ribokinase [Candidatus Atribacteria bacterium]